MNKVISISLNGNAYQLDEDGYDALRAYLERAESQLKDNPDRAEIVADLEQAIAEKCQKFLNPHKSVVTAAEVGQILTEMGPVDGAPGDAGEARAAHEPSTNEKAKTDTNATKRLYQIREGAMIGGVCKGLAAFFNIDVTIVRLIFVGLAIVTQGVWILAYIAMMFVIPYAHTSEERAAAHGLPFNAQELIDQAKRNYGDFKDNKEWGRHWRRQNREWRRTWQRHSSEWGQNIQQNVGYTTQVLAGVLMPVFALFNVAFLLIWVFVLISVVNTRAVGPWRLPVGVPLWVGIVGLVLLLNLVVWPLNAARRARDYAHRGHPYGHLAIFPIWGAFSWLVVTTVCFWLAYTHLPEVQQFIQDSIRDLPTIWNNIRSFFTSLSTA